MSYRSLPYGRYDQQNYVKIPGRVSILSNKNCENEIFLFTKWQAYLFFFQKRPVRIDGLQQTVGPQRIIHHRRPWSDQNRRINKLIVEGEIGASVISIGGTIATKSSSINMGRRSDDNVDPIITTPANLILSNHQSSGSSNISDDRIKMTADIIETKSSNNHQ